MKIKYFLAVSLIVTSVSITSQNETLIGCNDKSIMMPLMHGLSTIKNQRLHISNFQISNVNNLYNPENCHFTFLWNSCPNNPAFAQDAIENAFAKIPNATFAHYQTAAPIYHQTLDNYPMGSCWATITYSIP